jgi:hypothetical protein
VAAAPQHSAFFPTASVSLSAPICKWLWSVSNLKTLKAAARDAAPEVVMALQSIESAALTCGTSSNGSKAAKREEAPSRSGHVNVRQAADLLGYTDRAVRLACTEGRLSGRLVDGRWQVDTQDLDRFKDLRKSA